MEAIGGGAFMERCPVCQCDGSTHIESVGKSGVRSSLSLPLPESEHELVAQQRDALEGEGEYSDDIQSDGMRVTSKAVPPYWYTCHMFPRRLRNFVPTMCLPLRYILPPYG